MSLARPKPLGHRSEYDGRVPIAPADYPPPFAVSEVVAAPEAPADEQLEVGIAIVGGGPAGLACAVRLAQLLEADPELGESLGEVPIALVDKGRAVGAHQLSGAVVQPAPLLELFPGHAARGDDELRAGRARGRLLCSRARTPRACRSCRLRCTTRATTSSRSPGSRASWPSKPRRSA